MVFSWINRIRKIIFPDKPLGKQGEDAAARFLKKQGYIIVARSDRSILGEIDIVAVDKKTVVFVEVKTRRSDYFGQPEEAIDSQKQHKLTQLAISYLKRHKLTEYPARFDIIAITWPEIKKTPEIKHFKDAFPASF